MFKLRGNILLLATWRIKSSWFNNEFTPIAIIGPYGNGKTAYAIRVFLEYHFEKQCIQSMNKKYSQITKVNFRRPIHRAWANTFIAMDRLHKHNNKFPTMEFVLKLLKKRFFFTADQFMNYTQYLNNKQIRVPMVIMDDSATHLGKYKWNERKIQRFAETFELMRTCYASVIFTATQTSKVVKALRNLADLRIIKIIKPKTTPWWRQARYYKGWESVDAKKSGVRRKGYDDFRCYIPYSITLTDPNGKKKIIPKFIFKWYLKERRKYLGEKINEYFKAE